MRLRTMLLMLAAFGAPPLLAEGADSAGTVRCCVKLGIDGVVDPPRCLKVNFNITPKRLAKRPRRACRLLGGTPAVAAACTCA